MERSLSSEKETFAQNFKVLSRREFFEDIAKETENAKRRIWIRSMYLQYKEGMKSVEPYLQKAAQEGLDVWVVADAISLLVTDGIPSYLAKDKKRAEHKNATEEMFVRFKENPNIRVDITNPPSGKNKLVPYIGRNHIKLSAVDDTFYLGGSNWTDLRANDFMVKITNPDIVKTLEAHFDKFNEKKPDKDIEERINGENTLLIDRGAPGESIIYEKAIELIGKENNRICFVSQLLPEGNVLNELSKAQDRGAKVEIIVPKMSEIKDPEIYVLNRLAQKRLIRNKTKIPVTYLPFFVHAKLLIGSNSAIFGSHNFSETGVKGGTEEMAMQSSNPTLLNNLHGFVEGLKKKKI